MKRITVGIVDYGAGNHASLMRSLQAIGCRSVIGRRSQDLDAAEVLVLPGVGAFPPAMEALHRLDLVEYLREHARAGRPLVGICLGMQLLADRSYENCETDGLGLIPGEVVALENPHWHIGWNRIEATRFTPIFSEISGSWFYFNHSYTLNCPRDYHVCHAQASGTLVAAIQRGNVVGVQFHPEKSQIAGRKLLANIVEGLCRA